VSFLTAVSPFHRAALPDMLRFTRWITTAALVVAGLQLPCASAQDSRLLVFAAASMKNALDDVDAAFTKESGVKVVVITTQVGANEADRGRRSGRHIRVRRSEMDGLRMGKLLVSGACCRRPNVPKPSWVRSDRARQDHR
jgi:hypothetical protein